MNGAVFTGRALFMRAYRAAHTAALARVWALWARRASHSDSMRPTRADLMAMRAASIAAVLGRRREEAVDGAPRLVQGVHDLVFIERSVRVVIRRMAVGLHFQEMLGEIPYRDRVGAHDVVAAATPPRVSMIQSAIGLAPRGRVSRRLRAAGHRIGATPRQTVEQRIVGGADGAAQLRRARLAGVRVNQVGGYPEKLVGIHTVIPALRIWGRTRGPEKRRAPRAPAPSANGGAGPFTCRSPESAARRRTPA